MIDTELSLIKLYLSLFLSFSLNLNRLSSGGRFGGALSHGYSFSRRMGRGEKSLAASAKLERRSTSRQAIIHMFENMSVFKKEIQV